MGLRQMWHDLYYYMAYYFDFILFISSFYYYMWVSKNAVCFCFIF